MALSNELISQFVKVTKDEVTEKQNSVVYGTIKTIAGQPHVQIDGSDLWTPVSTTTDAKDGERVTVMIKNHTATATGNISSPAARIGTVDEIAGDVTAIRADYAEIGELIAEKATIEDLKATNAEINNLKAKDAEIDNLVAEKATIEQLNAVYADIELLDVDVADIKTLMFGSAAGNTLHTNFANAVAALIGDAKIADAMIQNLDASKITSGNIDTENVTIIGDDSRMTIKDGTIQIKDANNIVRVQIGKDASEDYSLNVWDSNGNLMFSEGGLTADAVKDKIIRDDMVADNANISSEKLDIKHLFSDEETDENGNVVKTLKSSGVRFEDGKRLDVHFNELNTTVTDMGDIVTSQGANLSVLQGQIESKVWQQDINEATGELETKYSNFTETVDGFVSEVGSTISNMSIGARNILINSSFATDAKGWEVSTGIDQDGMSFAETGFMTKNGFECGYISCLGSISGRTMLVKQDILGRLLPNTTYTLSVWLLTEGKYAPTYPCIDIGCNGWCTIDGSTRGIYYGNINPEIHTYPGTWEYVTSTFTTGSEIESAINLSFNLEVMDEFFGEVYFRNFKLEKGNKATDWSPAPEDVEGDISKLQDDIDDNKTNIVLTRTSIEQLKDSISTLVVGADGQSQMTQTEDGWRFDISGLLDDISDTKVSVSDLDSSVEVLKKNTEHAVKVGNYVTIGDTEDSAVLEIGGKNGFKLSLHSNAIQFVDDDSVPAWISNKKLNIDEADVDKASIHEATAQKLVIDNPQSNPSGSIVIEQRANGNVGFVWKG